MATGRARHGRRKTPVGSPLITHARCQTFLVSLANDMDLDLTNLTEEELIDLNSRIVDRIRILRQARCRDSMVEFSIGDRVTFKPECGHEITGTVVRLNRKSVTVVGSDGHQWRVSPSFLKKVSGENTVEDVKVAGAVISLDEHRRREA